MFKEFKTFSRFLFASVCLSASAVPVLAAAELVDVPVEQTEDDALLFLGIDEVVELVRSQSLETLIARESVHRALELSFQQRAALLPQLGVRAQQTRQQIARGFAGGEFETSRVNSFGARMEASQALFDPNRYANYRLSLLEHSIAELNFEVAVQDILEQAIQLYFTHLRDLRRIEVIAGNIERNQSLLDLAKNQFEAGAAIKLDVTRAEVRVATERRSLMEAQTLAEESMLQLKELLDVDYDREIVVDRSIIEGINAPPSLKRYGSMERMLEDRPELAGQQMRLDQAELASRAASWQRLPRVELFGDWGYDTDRAFDGGETEGWLVGVRVNVPIFEGGRISAEKREALAAARQNAYRMRDLKNRVEREFRFALLSMDSRYAQIEIARDEIRLGRDEVEQAEERYREGLADNRELIDAQQRLSDAETSHLHAVYLYGLSRLAFARAIGSAERVLE